MRPFTKSLLTIWALSAAGFLQAQTYFCKDNTGRTFQSSRPCANPGLIIYGPTERQTTHSTPFIPSVGKAPEHIIYMSPRCASLHDAMRTAPARGLKHAEMADMSREYSRDCGEDEMLARRKLSELRNEQRNEIRSAEKAKEQAVAQSRMSSEMCGELKRVIKNKKLRTDLTPGELGDLERSEQNYKARCS